MGLHATPPIETKAIYGNRNIIRAADGRAMPTPSSGRDSRRGSRANAVQAAAESGYASTDRREKAKSSQIYDGRRRGSKQVEVEERPRLKSRTNSAPLVDARLGGRDDGEQTSKGARKGQASAPQVGEAIGEDAQDSDEEAGVVGAVKDLKPFRSPEVRWCITFL